MDRERPWLAWRARRPAGCGAAHGVTKYWQCVLVFDDMAAGSTGVPAGAAARTLAAGSSVCLAAVGWAGGWPGATARAPAVCRRPWTTRARADRAGDSPLAPLQPPATSRSLARRIREQLYYALVVT